MCVYTYILYLINRDHTIVMIDHPIYWPGGKTNQVLGTPICGWKNENCTNSSNRLYLNIDNRLNSILLI